MLMLPCCSDFRDDAAVSEHPFSTYSITLEELGVVEEVAKSLGLYVTPRRNQASPVRDNRSAGKPGGNILLYSNVGFLKSEKCMISAKSLYD